MDKLAGDLENQIPGKLVPLVFFWHFSLKIQHFFRRTVFKVFLENYFLKTEFQHFRIKKMLGSFLVFQIL